MQDTLSRTMPNTLSPQKTILSGFDVSTPSGRAQFLVALKEKHTLFSKEDFEAYNALRDEMVLFARNVGSLEALQQHAERFNVFLISEIKKSEKTPVPTLSEERPTPTSAPVVVAESVSVLVKPQVVHRGPDIAIPEKKVVFEKIQETTSHDVISAPPVALESVVSEKKQGITREELQKRVFDINTGLNEFAHGKAFQWLSNPDTHYREYMNELIALRGHLTNVSIEEQELLDLVASTERLETLADVVRTAVGGEKKTEEVVSDISAPEVPKKEEILQAVVMPQTPAQTVKVKVETEEPRQIENLAEALSLGQNEVVESVTEVPEENVPWGAKEETLENTGAQIETAPAEQGGEQEVVIEQPSVAPHTETLHTPHIDTALNNLLTQWLGTPGFLGFGDSGVKHHDWLLMKDVFLEDVLVDTGVIPQGMKPDVYKNLTDNVRAWSTKYGLYNESPAETVENFLRRVVRASIVSAS